MLLHFFQNTVTRNPGVHMIPFEFEIKEVI